jgi:DNA-binding response OmpR family regulator
MKKEAPIKILLAEDNSGDVFLVRRALQKHRIEFDLKLVEDGEAAMEYFNSFDSCRDASECPDLIMLDLNLPRCSGAEVLEKIRSSQVCRHVPVIILTSSDSPHDRTKASSLGAVRYFCKPTHLAGFMMLGKVVEDVMTGVPVPAAENTKEKN